MLSVYDIQVALIARLKATTTLTDVVTSVEIREDQWQGTEFVYPNVRVRLLPSSPRETNCDVLDINFSILVFSEQDSSIQAEQIAGIINTALHARSFTSNSVRLSCWTVRQIPAIRQDTRTWRSEIIFRGTATG